MERKWREGRNGSIVNDETRPDETHPRTPMRAWTRAKSGGIHLYMAPHGQSRSRRCRSTDRIVHGSVQRIPTGSRRNEFISGRSNSNRRRKGRRDNNEVFFPSCIHHASRTRRSAGQVKETRSKASVVFIQKRESLISTERNSTQQE